MTTPRFVALLCVLALAPSSPVFAELYEAHDYSITPFDGRVVTGAGNVTIDTDSGLAWLDLTLTTFMSMSDVSAQTQLGGALAGYRPATVSEVTTFWQHAGLTVPNLWQSEESTKIAFLQSMWGVTATTEIPSPSGPMQTHYSTAVVSGSMSHDYGLWPLAVLTSRFDPRYPGDFAFVDEHFVVATGDISPDGAAPALVRPASEVPEPSTLMLATLGLLGGFGWWRKHTLNTGDNRCHWGQSLNSD